jgi:hypothetical protein
MENASLVLQGALKNIRDDGFDLNAMRGVDISNLLLDRLEKMGFVCLRAPVKRSELPGSFPLFMGKNHVAALACMMKKKPGEYTDIANMRVRWGVPIDEDGDIEMLARHGYAERDPVLRDRARATPAGEELVEQARAYGYRPEDKWSAMAR